MNLEPKLLLAGVALVCALAATQTAADPLPPDARLPEFVWQARVIGSAVAVDEDTGRVFAFDSQDDSVMVFTVNGALTGAIQLPEQPGIGEPGSLVFDRRSGLLYLCDGSLRVLDVDSLSVEGSYESACPAFGFLLLDADRDRLVAVGAFRDEGVYLIDLTDLPRTINYKLPIIGVSGVALDATHNTLYSSIQATGLVIGTDLDTGKSREVISGFGASALAFDNRTNLLYVAGGPSGLTVIDVETDTVVQTIEAGGSFLFLDPPRNRLLAFHTDIYSIDLLTGEPSLRRLLWVALPLKLAAFDSVRQRLYLQDDNILAAFDTGKLEQPAALPLVGGSRTEPDTSPSHRLSLGLLLAIIGLLLARRSISTPS